jgi:hypothetical protein
LTCRLQVAHSSFFFVDARVIIVVVERFQEHTTVKSFGWVLYAGFAEDGESLHVVERPPKHIAPKLPAPITHKRNYGKG